MIVIIWSVLFVIAVVDAREHRIPNRMVLLLIVFSAFYQWHGTGRWESLLFALGAGLLLFALGFVFYLLRAMSPGDVKLLAGIGVYLGWDELSLGIFWIAISCVIVGLMYGLLSRYQPIHSISEVASFDSLDKQESVPDKRLSGAKPQKKLQMPFAPVVVIGLALHSYFG